MAFKTGVWDQPPRFTHDCDNCFYVAPIDVVGQEPHDLWLCTPSDPAVEATDENTTAILRFSSEGSHYRSGEIADWKRSALRAYFLSREPALNPVIATALRVLYAHEWTR